MTAPATGADFPTLYKAVMGGDPKTLKDMADAWVELGGTAMGEAADMKDNLAMLRVSWQSPLARDAYSAKVQEAIDAMNHVSDVASQNGKQFDAAAQALTDARTQMEPLYQQYQEALADAAAAHASTPQLRATQQAAARIVQTLSDKYKAIANKVVPTENMLDKSSTNGTSSPGTQDGSTQDDGTQGSATQDSGAQDGSAATGQQDGTSAAQQGSIDQGAADQGTTGVDAAVTPTSLTTPTVPAGSSVGSIGDSTTIPPLTSTVPAGSVPATSVPISTVPLTVPASERSLLGGGFADEAGIGGLPGEGLAAQALPAEALPAETLAVEASHGAGAVLPGAGMSTTDGVGVAPFLPGGGMAGGGAATGRGGPGSRRPGAGLFDDEDGVPERLSMRPGEPVEEIRAGQRIGPAGAIEPVAEPAPGARHDRDRGRGGKDRGPEPNGLWGAEDRVAPAVLTAIGDR